MMNFEPSDQGTTMLKSNFEKLANDSWALSEWLSGRLICGKCPMHVPCKKYPRAKCKDLIFVWLITVEGQNGEETMESRAKGKE